MVKGRCNNNAACERTYMPLALAFARTIHSFQGASVGKTPPGQPENTFHRIIAYPGPRKQEGSMPGLFYTLLSRATTLGEEGKLETSAILFNGTNMTPSRIRNITRKADGKLYSRVHNLRQWVNYLNKHHLPRVTSDKVDEMLKWANNIMENPINQTELAKWVNDAVRMG